MLEHSTMARMRERHPDWIWNRSDTHAFVAVPGTHESFKTPAEPGNSFSPGPSTYGVATWVHVHGTLHAPEEKPLAELRWSFAEGHLPLLVAAWNAGPLQITSRLFADGDAERSDIKNYLRVEIENPAEQAVAAMLYLVIRSFGAAGGPIKQLAMHDRTVHVNGAPLIYAAEEPSAFGALSYAESNEDISVYLKRGELPETTAVEDPSSWASGALTYQVTLQPGERRHYDFVFHLHAGSRMLDWLQPPPQPIDYDAAERAFVEGWRARLLVQLDLPDQRFVDAFNAQLAQLYSFTVGDAPRITPVTYPLWWVRDGAYIVVALDRGGLHDVAERACRDAVRVDPMTGFGGEADVPGELIWMLSEHFLLTRDAAYLHDMFPFIMRKADLLIRMRHTTEPLRMPYEFVTHEHALRPDVDLLCRPAQNGLIVGRMDHHFPLFWVNAFAYLGLRRAALCARALGEDGTRYAAEADALREAMHRHIGDPETGFGSNERDTVAALWPCGWAAPDNAELRQRYDAWWNTARCPNGVYTPERLWTYFEVGQAHNYLLLGQQNRAWTTLDYFLDHHSAPGLYQWSEGERDENSALLLWQKTRGWDRIRFVTPNGWTGAEMFLLLRDCLVREDGDALVLGSGVPEAWLAQPFAARNMPTHFGPVSFTYRPDQRRVEVQIEHVPGGGIQSGFPLPVEIHTNSTTKGTT